MPTTDLARPTPTPDVHRPWCDPSLCSISTDVLWPGIVGHHVATAETVSTAYGPYTVTVQQFVDEETSEAPTVRLDSKLDVLTADEADRVADALRVGAARLRAIQQRAAVTR